MTASRRHPRGPNGGDPTDTLRLGIDLYRAGLAYWSGVFKYTNEFMLPYWTALNAFLNTEKDKLVRYQPADSFRDYFELFQFNLQVAEKGLVSSLAAMNEHHTATARRAFGALMNTLEARDGEGVYPFWSRQAELLEYLVYEYPRAIRDIKALYGFHFDDGGYRKAAETDRFFLYQVMPRNGAAVRADGKPILIVPPYVLGANILAFLPAENKSYVHAYADQGIPTYVRIMKDIDTTPAVQTLTGEADALDLRFFSEHLLREHGRPTTLNGFCQGGFVALTGLLSGELDGLVDALITCVAPMDGTRSRALIDYLRHLPPRFRDLGYAVKTLPNGNRVVDGKVMSWVYKLKSMEKEAPIYTFYQDLMRMDRSDAHRHKIANTAAAINHWLIYDRNDLPEGITRMSFASYTVPVAADGTLPFTLFGRPLNFRRLKEMQLPFLICYGAADDLVDQSAALAPLDFVPAEVTAFPKGHGAIATSWSNPETEYALHKRYPDNSRGPVRFQLDLEQNG